MGMKFIKSSLKKFQVVPSDEATMFADCIPSLKNLRAKAGPKLSGAGWVVSNGVPVEILMIP